MAGVTHQADPRATDHLANERTFLAWFRTGLTLIAFGIAAGQLLTLNGNPGFPVIRALSSVVVATGALLIGIGTRRYWTNRDQISRAQFRPAGSSILLATGAALLTAGLAVVFIWLLPGR